MMAAVVIMIIYREECKHGEISVVNLGCDNIALMKDFERREADPLPRFQKLHDPKQEMVAPGSQSTPVVFGMSK